jgi:hypothetical protein
MNIHKSEVYNITVIDKVNQRKSELTLDDAIKKYNCNLSNFDSVMLNLVTHDTLTSYKQYKPAKSTLITTTCKFAIATKPINYSDYSSLSCKFASPELSSVVFLDKIEVTVYLKKSEAKKLANRLHKSVKKHTRITFNERMDTKTKYKSAFNIKDKLSSHIAIHLDPVFRKNNRLKIAYNPNYANKNDLSSLRRIIKDVTGNDYRHRILNANITRFDVTFDGDGYTVENLLLSLNKGTYFKQFVNQCGEVETKIIGASKALRVIIYNKVLQAKLDNEPYVKTRFEVTIRPFNIKKLGGLKFKHINELPLLFSSLMVFDKVKVERSLGSTSVDWNIIKDFGISALRRTKNNTDRIKLSKQLNECRLVVDVDGFNRLIIKLLKVELKALL